MDDTKSSGPNSIPIKLLKIGKDTLSTQLCNIYNLSFQQGVFPSKNKIAKIIPVFKSGSKDDINNYRPISLLSTFSKIHEKLIFTRLTNFLEVNQILYPRQYGFRPGFSTTFSLIDITETIRNSIDQKKFGCGIFLDLKKAFDTVNHDMLLTKLEHYGIRDISLNWFKSYLSDRKQFVHINGQNSSLCDIVCGVPQGSVLGPLLFLLYVNDLPNISKKLNFFLFADDTNIYLDSFNLYSLQTIVNKELSKLYDWLCINRLSLNISKTNFVIFNPPNKPTSTVTILINKIAIKEESFVKYLGIFIDSKLTFKFHIEELKKKFLDPLVSSANSNPLFQQNYS